MLALRTNTTVTAAAPLARLFTTTTLRAIKDSSKTHAIALDINTKLPKSAIGSGNSFSSFAEYRKSAISHGPLAKKLGYRSNATFKPMMSEDRDYGVSESFAKAARSNAYRD